MTKCFTLVIRCSRPSLAVNILFKKTFTLFGIFQYWLAFGNSKCQIWLKKLHIVKPLWHGSFFSTHSQNRHTVACRQVRVHPSFCDIHRMFNLRRCCSKNRVVWSVYGYFPIFLTGIGASEVTLIIIWDTGQTNQCKIYYNKTKAGRLFALLWNVKRSIAFITMFLIHDAWSAASCTSPIILHSVALSYMADNPVPPTRQHVTNRWCYKFLFERAASTPTENDSIKYLE